MSASASASAASAAPASGPPPANARSRKSAGAAGPKRLKPTAPEKRGTRFLAAASSVQDVSAATQKVQDVLEKDPLSEQILALRQEQDALRRQRKDLSKTLRLAEKKKTRLRKRAKALTDEDLIQVLMMRKEQREYAAPGAAAEAQSAGTSVQAADASRERADAAEQHDDGAGSCADGA